MFDSLLHYFHEATEIRNFTFDSLVHMMIRGVIIYALGIALLRFNKKLFGVSNSFNMILFVILGSILADAIVSAEHFLLSIATVLLLTTLNFLMTMASFYIPAVESFMEGTQQVIVINGQIQWDVMKKNLITKRELLGELCTQLHTQDLAMVETAMVASDGRIKFVKRHTQPA